MKILLITPLAKYNPTKWVPLGMSYISALLKQNNHQVQLYDRFLRNYILESEDPVNLEMKSEILRYKPDIIGFSTVSPLIYDTLECIKYIRNFYKGIIVAGGHHATAMPLHTLKKIPGLDYVLAGEAEYSMLSLANGKNPSDIPGLFSINKDISNFKQAQISELDKLPIPDYEIFDMNYYTQANRYTLRGFFLKTACIITSRGCINNCNFCTESLTFGKGVRFHGADYVIENIEKLVKDYKIDGIYFHDNNFLASFSHAEGICRKIIKHNLHKKIKWVVQASSSGINNDILKLLSEAGCIKIEIGIESLRDCDLRSINKNSTADLNEKILLMCKKNKIKVHTYFMTGFKDESILDLNNLIKWIKKYKPHTFSLSMLKIYPGTSLYENARNMFFEDNSWTRNNIDNFFSKNIIGNINDEEKIKWYRQTFNPFFRKYDLLAAMKVNSLRIIMKMAYLKYSSS